MSKTRVLAGVLCIFISVAVANAALYTGSLTYTPPAPPDVNDGLMVGPPNLQWVNYTLGISWTVTDTDNSYPGFPWKYTYTFGHNGTQAGISHIIIEASEGISSSDITGLEGATITSVGPQTVQSGNPNMPEDLAGGIRFNPLSSGLFSMTWSFFSNRQPVWEDFYARCGGFAGGINYAYNYNMDSLGVERGFLSPDTDPLDPPSNGSVEFHILGPDAVPEPATLSLLAFGGLVLLRRR